MTDDVTDGFSGAFCLLFFFSFLQNGKQAVY